MRERKKEKEIGVERNVKQEKGFIAPFVCASFLLIIITFNKFTNFLSNLAKLQI